MSNDVQSREDVGRPGAGDERRGGIRHAGHSLGSVTARIIGGSQVELVNFSNRGVLFECDSRLLIGARASVRITTTDANLVITGRVVRSRVKGLVNGALRYDAALVLDAELGLAPTILEAMPMHAGDPADAADELSDFQAAIDQNFAPSPVEAYLAESEASLLDVAPSSDLPLHAPDIAQPDVAQSHVAQSHVAQSDLVQPHMAESVAFEPPPIPAHASPVFASASPDPSADPEPIAFEADAEVAFEPAVEFAFDEGVELAFDHDAPLESTEALAGLVAAATVEPEAGSEPAGSSMFDATYLPAAVDNVAPPESQFAVRAPSAVLAGTPSSFFDARPSEHYGERPAEPSEAAFETEEVVAFEAVPAAVVDDAVIEPSPFDDSPDESLAPPTPADGGADDRVLLQFAATVPHDLAELRRIAADNQW